MLTKNIDYLICEKASFMSPKAPTSITTGVCVGTKDYLFFIPTQTVGNFPMLQTFKNHKIFDGFSVEEGTKMTIGSAKSVEALENTLIEVLENNKKYVHHIPSYKSFVISGIFIKNNMRLIQSRFDYYVCILKPKNVAKEFREFYGK